MARGTGPTKNTFVLPHFSNEAGNTAELLLILKNRGVPIFRRALMAFLLLAGFAAAQEHVSFPTQDGGLSTPMCMDERSASSCWLMEGGSTNKVGRDRRGC